MGNLGVYRELCYATLHSFSEKKENLLIRNIKVVIRKTRDTKDTGQQCQRQCPGFDHGLQLGKWEMRTLDFSELFFQLLLSV